MKTNYLLNFILFLALLHQGVFSFSQSKVEKLFYNGEYEKVLSVLEPEIENKTARESEYVLAAKCYLAAYQYSDAAACFENVLDTDPENYSAREGLADIQSKLGHEKEALHNYSILAMPAKHDSLRIGGKKASALMDLYQYNDAAGIFSELLELDSANVFFFSRLMAAKYKQKQYLPVVELYIDTTVCKSCKADKEVKMMVADSYSKFGDYKHSLELLNELLEQDSTYIPALSKTAYIYFSTYKNYEDAVVLYRRLNGLKNYANPFHLRNQAICEYFTGNYDVAAPVLDSLITEISNDAFIPFYAGLAYKELREFDKSLELLELASKIVIPVYTGDIFHHLGRAYASRREFEKAIRTYKKVLEYDPANYHVLYDIAVTYEEYNLNRTMALGYYELFIDACTNVKSSNYQYAQNRVKRIKEELFFEGEE
jgi:tetratricopeptide (TPR) repeat protein